MDHRTFRNPRPKCKNFNRAKPRAKAPQRGDASGSGTPAALGIDMGMTATRASIGSLSPEDESHGSPIKVSRGDQHSQVFDIPSMAYIFRFNWHPSQCLNDADDNNHESFPIKMIFYLFKTLQYQSGERTEGQANGSVRGIQFKLRDKIPQLNYALKEYDSLSDEDKAKLVPHLRAILREHLKIVKRRSDAVAKRHQLNICKLAVSIPPNWDSSMCDEYVSFLADTWDSIDKQEITLLFEAEALGHWMFRFKPGPMPYHEAKQIIVVDFGGHTLSTYFFGIARHDEGKEFSFYSIREASCSHGGAELHTSWIKKDLLARMRKRLPRLESQEIAILMKDTMDNYCDSIRASADGSPFTLKGSLNKLQPNHPDMTESRWEELSSIRNRVHEFNFAKSRANKMYEDAIMNPIQDLLEDMKSVDLKSGKVFVVLTGGTFLNEPIKKHAANKLTTLGFNVLTDIYEDIAAGSRSSLVSMGICLAVVNSLSLEEFIQRAAFVIDRGGINDTGLPITLINGESKWHTLDYTTKNRRELSIACCTRPPTENAKKIKRSQTYQFWSLGTQKSGTYEMRLSYEKEQGGQGHTDWLVFEYQKVPTRKKSLKVTNEDTTQAKKIRWPIYYDPGACVCFIDHEKNSCNVQDQEAANLWLEELQRPSLEKWQARQRDSGAAHWEESVIQEKRDVRLRSTSLQAQAQSVTGSSSTNPIIMTGETPEVSTARNTNSALASNILNVVQPKSNAASTSSFTPPNPVAVTMSTHDAGSTALTVTTAVATSLIKTPSTITASSDRGSRVANTSALTTGRRTRMIRVHGNKKKQTTPQRPSSNPIRNRNSPLRLRRPQSSRQSNPVQNRIPEPRTNIHFKVMENEDIVMTDLPNETPSTTNHKRHNAQSHFRQAPDDIYDFSDIFSPLPIHGMTFSPSNNVAP